MLKNSQSSPPSAGSEIRGPKSGRRKPLQPINYPATQIIISKHIINPTTKLVKAADHHHHHHHHHHHEWTTTEIDDKENHHHHHHHHSHPHPRATPTGKIEYSSISLDASLAEELSAIREKLERLRSDKDKTENMLQQRDLLLDTNFKELSKRGEFQKNLEIELDRLYRLNQLKSSCIFMRTSPIRSLREKKQGRKLKDQSQEIQAASDKDESKVESALQTPTSHHNNTGI